MDYPYETKFCGMKNCNYLVTCRHPGPEQNPDLPVHLLVDRAVTLTGEFDHLTELIKIILAGKTLSFGTDCFADIVTPVLAALEQEINRRYNPHMNQKEMKLLIQDWIDREISSIRKQRRQKQESVGTGNST